MKKLGIISLGIAVFAMFFGAGNVVFPIILGRAVAGNVLYALIGFTVTAVIVPIVGFIATILYEGDYDKFFSTIGKIPAFLLITLCMIIIGPLGASRCVIISFAAIKQYLPFSLFVYSFIIAAVVFILAFKENRVVPILGRFLGPVKITLLTLIIILIIFSIKQMPSSALTTPESFFAGLREGYFTLDLIGAFFFSHLLYISMTAKSEDNLAPRSLMIKGTKAGIIGGALLGLIYAGFAIGAAIYGPEMKTVADEQLFSALSVKILGDKGGVLANSAIALATLTTAIALTAVFADYLCFEIFKGKVAFPIVLAVAIGINVVLENLQFAGIMKIIAPIAILVYPAFIVLSLGNICKKLFGFKYIKLAVGATFIITAIFQYII